MSNRYDPINQYKEFVQDAQFVKGEVKRLQGEVSKMEYKMEWFQVKSDSSSSSNSNIFLFF